MPSSTHHFHGVDSISVFVAPSLREGEETMSIHLLDKDKKDLRTIAIFFNGKADVVEGYPRNWGDP